MVASRSEDWGGFSPEFRANALEILEARLRERGSPLGKSPEAIQQIRGQTLSVLDEVQEAVARHTLDVSTVSTVSSRVARTLTEEIGSSRALQGIHPAESVGAGAVMFETLLPIVVREVPGAASDEALTVRCAVTIHSSILRRIGIGATSYASFLLKKVNSSQQDERHRIARELHDRAAHAVAVALQDLELYEAYAEDEKGRAQAKLVSARTMLREALDVVREVAEDLRQSAMSEGGLHKALAAYLESRAAQQGLRTSVTVTGDVARLHEEVTEELYIVLREAIRNAVLHAGAHSVEVEIELTGNAVHALVRDDGRGFKVGEALASPTGIGLFSMRERVELLGGVLTLHSELDQGTTVEVMLTDVGPA